MVNWFPLYKKLMEDSEQFRALTPVEKLYFWLLISEFNARGPFYRADLEFAVTLAISEDKIRRARPKLQKLNWIKVRPGFQSKGKNVATLYEHVAGAAIVENEHFAQIHRYAIRGHACKATQKSFQPCRYCCLRVSCLRKTGVRMKVNFLPPRQHYAT